MTPDDFDEWDDDEWDDVRDCHTCHGDGWVVLGEDEHPRFGWDAEGEIVRCRNCGGIGLKRDCTIF